MSHFPQVLNLKSDQIATVGGILASDTTFTLLAGTAFGSPSTKVVLKVDNELIRCTVTGPNVTQAERGFGGTTAAVHAQSAAVVMPTPAEYLNAYAQYMEYGWMDLPAFYTATYASATTFTLPGDWTDVFSKGDKLKIVNAATTKYFYVIAVSFASATTTVTLNTCTDYSLASGSLAVSVSKAASPAGFPGWFGFSPAMAASSGTFTITTIQLAHYRCDGNMVTVQFDIIGSQSATTSGIRFAVPVPAVTDQASRVGTALCGDNGTYVSGWSQVIFSGSNVAVQKYNNATFAASTNNTDVAGTISYRMA